MSCRFVCRGLAGCTGLVAAAVSTYSHHQSKEQFTRKPTPNHLTKKKGEAGRIFVDPGVGRGGRRLDDPRLATALPTLSLAWPRHPSAGGDSGGWCLAPRTRAHGRQRANAPRACPKPQPACAKCAATPYWRRVVRSPSLARSLPPSRSPARWHSSDTQIHAARATRACRYDASQWAATHPGGAWLLEYAMGRDVTALFYAAHLRHHSLATASLAKLPKLQLEQVEAEGGRPLQGEYVFSFDSERPPAAPPLPPIESELRAELRDMLRREFADRGAAKATPGHWARTLIAAVGTLACWAGWLGGSISATAVLPLVHWVLIAHTVHEATHGAAPPAHRAAIAARSVVAHPPGHARRKSIQRPSDQLLAPIHLAPNLLQRLRLDPAAPALASPIHQRLHARRRLPSLCSRAALKSTAAYLRQGGLQ